MTACIHCGTTFRPTPHRSEHCCSGCEFVHKLIAGNGLGQFYDFQRQTNAPVTPLVFQKRDFAWLEDLAADADGQLSLDLQGVSCIGCVWLVERLWQRKPGSISVRTDPTTGRIDFRWEPGKVDLPAFARELQSFGYLLGPPSRDGAPPSRALVLRIGLCGAFAMNTMLFTLPGYLGMESSFEFAELFETLTFIFSTLSLIVGGSYFIGRTFRSLRNGLLHLDLPISLGLVAAYAGSVTAWLIGGSNFLYFDFVSIFVFLMLAGRWVQQRSVERNRSRLLGLQAEPPSVTIGGKRESAASLRPGTAYSLGSGAPVPVRSQLVSPDATFGMEWINGESDSREATVGQLVPSGAMNLRSHPVELEATESWVDSLLARLLAAPPAAAADRTFERFIRVYILVVLALGIGGSAAWLAVGAGFPVALQVLVSILVVSCPCALGVALPLADELAASRLRKLGVFVRDGTLWSRLRRVHRVVFDKTGTLTLETLGLENPEVLAKLSEPERRLLARLVRDNLHPVSSCLRAELMSAGVVPADVSSEVVETIGFGVTCESNGVVWSLGRPASGMATDCVFRRDDDLLAGFEIREQVRPGAADEVAALRDRGLEVHILSGDRAARVAAMAAALDLPSDRCHGGMSPEGKAAWLRETGADDALMIGDGANDSLAFNESLCRGTPAIDRGLLEQKADFYFLGSGLGGIRALFESATRRAQSVKFVFAFAVVYNLVVIGVCLAGRMNPLVAAILMPLSSVVSLAIVFAGSRPAVQSVNQK